MPIKFTNFANSRLAVGVGSGDVTLAVTGGQGARFPTLGAGDFFYATIENASLQREIVKVTARTGDTLTVVRGQDNTTALAWNAGDSIALRFNAAAIVDSLGAPLDGSVTTAKLADDAVTFAKMQNIATARLLGRATAGTGDVEELTGAQAAAILTGSVGQLAGLRNKIINGKMEIAQRGTSFAAIAHDAYSLDRWQWQQSGTGVNTASQQADVPASNEFQNSLRLAVTTADTSIAATDNYSVWQIIEGYNVRDLIGRTFTLSFWVRSSKTGVHCVSLVNNVGDRSYVAEYTVNAANTWEAKSITVSGGLITAGSWNWTNGVGLRVGWALAAGSTFQTTSGAWQTGNFLATANQVNCLDTIGNIFAITGVQLEVGSVATPFEHRPFGVELALCQRYYEMVNLERLGGANPTGYVCSCNTTASSYVNLGFAAVKRTVPTLVVFGSPSIQQGGNVPGPVSSAAALNQTGATVLFGSGFQVGVGHIVGAATTAILASAEL